MSKKLLRKKLALMLAQQKKPRPYYCEVEYLKASGAQYIDTGIMGKSGVRASVGFEWDTSDIGQDRYILAAADGYYGRCYFGTFQSKWMYGYSSYWQYGTPAADTRYDAEVSWELGNQYMKINGETLHTGTITNPLNTTWTMYMFARNQGSPGWYSSAKIYYCKMWDNGVLVRDFIPVLDWDMNPAMYDKVSKQLFYNLREGVSDFTYGREIHYVDYLEGTGTQYIDTKEKVDSTTKIILDFQMTDITSGTNGIFGASTSQTLQFLTQTTNNKFVFQWTPNSIGNVGTKNTNRNTVILDIPNKVLSIGIDSLSISSYTFSYPTGNIFLMANGHTSVYGRMKVFGCKIFSDSSVLKDFYPAIDENGVGFMLDKVSHTIYDNAGTGVFKYPARETEYTANAATYAYIDLGVKYKPSMSIEGKYTRNDYGNNGSVMLLTTTTAAPLIYLPALSGYTAERYVWRRPPYTEQSYFISTITYPFTCEIKVDAVNDVLTLNGNVVKTGMIAGMNGYDSPYESSSNMYMFSIASTYAGDGKIYYLKITDGTTPLFDLIPAYKDGEAGFYNKIDGTFFKNANSSGLLTAGKIVEPEYE